MIRRLRARLRTRRQRRLAARLQQLTSGGHVTPADLDRLASGGVTAAAHFTAYPDGTLTCRYGHVVPDGQLAEHLHAEPNRNHMARGGWIRPGTPLPPPMNGCVYSASEVAGYGKALLDAINRPTQEEPR